MQFNNSIPKNDKIEASVEAHIQTYFKNAYNTNAIELDWHELTTVCLKARLDVAYIAKNEQLFED